MYCVCLHAKVPGDVSTIAYALTQNEKHYGFECWLEGGSRTSAPQRCVLPDISDNFDQAESLLYLLARHAVLPVHIPDVLEDLNSL